MSIITILVVLILIGLLFWAVRTLGAAFGVPSPVLQVAYVFLVVLCVLWLLSAFGLLPGPAIRITP